MSRTEGVKLQKGDVVLLQGTMWPAVVYEATKHGQPFVRPYATVNLYVFGFHAEMGSAYMTDLMASNTPRGREVLVLDVRVPEDEADMRRYAEAHGHSGDEFVAEARKWLAKRPKPKAKK
jgi:hypothetical protein